MHAAGRPVLIGTRSIDKSEIVSKLLTARGIRIRCSTPITSPAKPKSSLRPGKHRRVTVSTNMAGRGTDIKLGPGVVELGGLHVILTEMHDSARIDRQLIGRCGRQGDPGTYRQYLSLDDELLMGLGPGTGRRTESDRREGARAIATATAGCFGWPSDKIETAAFSRPASADVSRERTRRRSRCSMGQNPYLDTPG